MKKADKKYQYRAEEDLALRASSIRPDLLLNRRHFCIPLAENLPKHEAVHDFSINATLKSRKSKK